MKCNRLEQTEEVIEIKRPIHYLGSKLRMLQTIKNTIDDVDGTCGMVCDLFSGSGIVSSYLSQYRPVMACDIQEYSRVINSALLGTNNSNIDIDQFIISCTSSNFKNECIQELEVLLEYEEKCIKDASTGSYESLYEIIDKGSILTYEIEKDENVSDGLKLVLDSTVLRIREKGWDKTPLVMMTRYYGGLYFSYSQALMMDVILERIFASENENSREVLLAAMLSTASEIVNTVGKQFAQPLKVRDSKNKYKKSLLKKIMEDRSGDVMSIYRKWLEYYIKANKSSFRNVIYKSEFKDTLESLKKENVKVIYADPPYTRYHYSRYYHVLESICLRDNPEVSTTFPNGKGGISRGIYRKDRYQSEFCIKTQAESAFVLLFQKCSELNIPLVLSYSPFEPSQAVTPRLQTIDQLVEKAQEYYDSVEIISPGAFKHSKLNSCEKNFESNSEAELLIVCK